MTEIRVPTLGESVTEATIGQWLKKEGDTVKADEPIVELETDKVSVEVPAPAAGVLSKITAKEGDTVELNALLGEIEEGASGEKPPAASKDKKTNGAAAKSEGVAKGGAKDDSTSASEGKDVEIIAPSSGESVTEADIGEWLVKVGDYVNQDDPVVSLETDKASMDVPAPVSGTLKEIKAEAGSTVAVGDVLGIIAEGADGSSKSSADKSSGDKSSGESKIQGQGPANAPTPRAEASGGESVAAGADDQKLSPAPRRVIEEHNLDASRIEGTGKDGRITKGDALAALESGYSKPSQSKAPAPSAPRELGDREERVKMSRLRQTIARRLKESQDSAAMLTTFNDVDMTAVMDARKSYKDLFEKKHGVKLGFMSFFVKACIAALKEVPDVNAEIDGTDIIYKNHYDIGIAVGTEKGLVVPVLRDADHMSLAGIEKQIVDYGTRARKGDLKLDEMQGGTFTITNGGIYGSLMSTPILNMPQSGILGMHRIEDRPVVVDGEIVIRPMMYLALSYDHRIVDGKGAVTFLVRVKENLEDPQRLLLDL
ncbi:2-oxoglutarate dehydrogenase complex dihydrolipoyllysine-residue succinyltransferase [Aquisalinus flavus]|uniref:Dihydrolipoyllysine-residue succinyltransferase n=1 Tax=Aquisalinus flavus TaxID=1526572 RepID=A0A8J2V358_9PROT|nr:2-oxoglutarate dehydrogenase complex dihydrolipoyllysine-residue succinyltransferase [Aquisalinus flavus]MBD0426333.1 2-oxoglutarate dehydrogenase complex dihydrolipoyllysine-residue succinyltransferase [Aquisalinus flavus]UNE48101.1 2-oxoglutarate dehydrogenase complex dihydrolipoyllysine-residue succinyltransferase [Aquisalinus flavus]GGD08815.1 dihydrolipoyllysine-residue succinyltransferase component of 2-oxoglutarate dehydrogenase complex [Aquisalinus flavus]